MMFKRVHKWLSLVVFVQLFIWLGSGFLLGKLDMDKAAGRDTFVRNNPTSFASIYENTDDNSGVVNKPFISVKSLLEIYPMTSEIELSRLVNKVIYKLKINAGQHDYQASNYKLVDAISGELIDLSAEELAATDKKLINQIASFSYKDSAFGSSHSQHPTLSPDQAEKMSVASLLYPPIEDLPRERNAVWQINVDDVSQTSIYIRAQTGDVIAHVNNETRWRDLLLMLHFMDYAEEGSFNNWFIKIFAVMTLLLSGTGVWGLIGLFSDGRIKITWFERNKTLLVHSEELAQAVTLSASANTSILEALSASDVDIKSICGGGGVCGTCKFKGEPEFLITAADRERLTPNELVLGYRLACQHVMKEVSNIELNPLTKLMD
jgi:ferredoxin